MPVANTALTTLVTLPEYFSASQAALLFSFSSSFLLTLFTLLHVWQSLIAKFTTLLHVWQSLTAKTLKLHDKIEIISANEINFFTIFTPKTFLH
ncbi:MAG: hypothetical protein ACD_82C00018G0001 [uncultured bacterium]|nr:MAG: hypothetical protein ACD_82C00018G0001 [uncultured bacterium]